MINSKLGSEGNFQEGARQANILGDTDPQSETGSSLESTLPQSTLPQSVSHAELARRGDTTNVGPARKGGV